MILRRAESEIVFWGGYTSGGSRYLFLDKKMRYSMIEDIHIYNSTKDPAQIK